jgi:hypothetical protein
MNAIARQERLRLTEAFRFAAGYLPTATQELLLRAALLPGKACEEAFQRWMATADIDHLDEGSFRTLPLLFRNLRAQGIRHPFMTRLKGIHHRAWYKNQVLFAEIVPVLKLFHDSGIRTMLLKGVPLSLLHYQDSGARPMRDIDVLVPEEMAADALRLLAARNWVPLLNLPRDLSRLYKSARHAVGCRDREGCEFDLHWHVLHWWPRLDADQDFWKHSIPLDFQGVRTCTLDPTDQLVHVCTHAAEWSPTPAIRWVPDAVTILRSAIGIDWDRIRRYARQRKLALFLAVSLSYVREKMDAPIPDALLSDLFATYPSRLDLLQYAHATGADLNLLQSLSAAWLDYLRCAPRGNLIAFLMEFPRFYQYRKDMERLSQIPGYVCLGLAKRARFAFANARAAA